LQKIKQPAIFAGCFHIHSTSTLFNRMDLDILILRDQRESIKKCSLTPLRGKPGVTFVNYHSQRRIDAGGRILLDPEGEPFQPEDAGRGLFLIDCSWRRLKSLDLTVDGEPIRRRLPELRTAYPRKSTIFDDPATGLASIEALYAAACELYGPHPDLLEGYHWAKEFLELNPQLAQAGAN
jgi:pre-rRNA-processing protein TSR3